MIRTELRLFMVDVAFSFIVPPYWQMEPSDAAVLLNGSLTISCEARGHPTPTIYWTKFSGKILNSVFQNQSKKYIETVVNYFLTI